MPSCHNHRGILRGHTDDNALDDERIQMNRSSPRRLAAATNERACPPVATTLLTRAALSDK